MTNIISHSKLKQFAKENTRSIDIGGGETRSVRLTPYYWSMLEWIEMLDGHTIEDLAAFAFEEVELQGFTFQEAFRCVVSFLSVSIDDFLSAMSSRRFDTAIGPQVVTLSHLDWHLVDGALNNGAISLGYLLNQSDLRHAAIPDQNFSIVFFDVIDDQCYQLSEVGA